MARFNRHQGLALLKLIPDVEEAPRLPIPPGPEEIAVHNRASLSLDHTTYAENRQQVVAAIAHVAAAVGKGDEALRHSPDEENQALRRHVTSVRLLGAARVLNFATAAIVEP